MKESEEIVDLIKSLSKTEKRYFKVFISRTSIGESSHYLKLFDLIEKAGTAEKRVIQELHEDKDFIKKQFNVYKGRLFNQILKSLSAYHSEKSVDDKILELIRQAIILFNKILYPSAEKVLERAQILALKYEKYTLLLEIIRWQKKIIIASSIFKNTSEKDLIKFFEDESLTVKKIDNINEYRKQYTLFCLYHLTNGGARKQEDIEGYNRLIDLPMLQNEELALSYHAKRDLYNTYGIYYAAIYNGAKSVSYYKKILLLMESLPHQIEEDPVKYVNIFYNLLCSVLSLKQYEELFEMIPKLKSMLRKFQFPVSIHLRTCHLELSAYLYTGQVNKGLTLLTEIEDHLKKEKNTNERSKLLLSMEIAMLYFTNRDYHNSLVNLNLALNKKNIGGEYYNFAKVFQLIVHFEKGNTELLPYISKSVYRHLMQKKQLHKIESVFIQFIRTRIHTIRTVKDQVEAFKALREELVKISDDLMEARFLEFFDIISWLESKIENRPFDEILREKSGFEI